MEGAGSVRCRELFCRLLCRGERIGALQFLEFEAEPFSGAAEFCDTMDSESQETYELAVVLCSVWRDVTVDVAMYGTILEFHRTWMSQAHSRSGVWIKAGEAMIKRFGQHAILVTKAFPLEYRGCAQDQSAETRLAQYFLRRRQLAMIRYYRHVFDLTALPGAAGESGWLWRPNPRCAGSIPKPRRESPSSLRRTLGI
jgi:hypothetical protein